MLSSRADLHIMTDGGIKPPMVPPRPIPVPFYQPVKEAPTTPDGGMNPAKINAFL